MKTYRNLNIHIPRSKKYHNPLVRKETHELNVETAERWGPNINIIDVYHISAQVASHFDSAEEFAALASTLQPERLQETDNG